MSAASVAPIVQRSERDLPSESTAVPNDDKLAETKRQIRERLRKVCSHMAADDFEALVGKIALNELTSGGNGAVLGYTWKVDDEE